MSSLHFHILWENVKVISCKEKTSMYYEKDVPVNIFEEKRCALTHTKINNILMNSSA